MMSSIWIINQHANTLEMPGHTRQYEIAEGLYKKGWEIDIFSSDFNLSKRKFYYLRVLDLSRSEKIAGINWHWLKVFPYRKNNWRRYINIFSFSIHVFFKLLIGIPHHYLYQKSPQIILASSPQLPAAFISLLVAKLFKKPFILEVRDLYPQVLIDQGGNKSSSFYIKFLTTMEKFLYRNSSHIIVLAKGSKKYVKEKGGLNISWLPNGPNLNQFKCEKIKKEPKKFTFSEPFKIYYTGAHGEANSLYTVIDAARLLEKLPILLILVGDGPEKNDLIKYSKGLRNVIFKDSMPKKKIPHLLKDANAILITLKNVKLFRYGVSPNKLYDAYALSKPVITNIVGDINNEVESNYLGVTAKPEDPEALAIAIKKLFMKTPEERKKMSQNGRKIAEKIYSREKIINSYNQILKNIIK
tara:strand:+ start:40089 stop:41327 length:1239 start_codon:yes stop_codon:yes gene_type:complete